MGSQNIISTGQGSLVDDEDGYLDGAYSGDNGLASLAELNRPLMWRWPLTEAFSLPMAGTIASAKYTQGITTIAGNPIITNDNGPAKMIRISTVEHCSGADAVFILPKCSPPYSVLWSRWIYQCGCGYGLFMVWAMTADWPQKPSLIIPWSTLLTAAFILRIPIIVFDESIPTDISAPQPAWDWYRWWVTAGWRYRHKSEAHLSEGRCHRPDGSLYIADSGNNCIADWGLTALSLRFRFQSKYSQATLP